MNSKLLKAAVLALAFFVSGCDPITGGLLAFGIGAQGPVNEKVSQLQRKAMLRDLYLFMQTYQEDFGTFPSVQPESADAKGGGVCDLYPLAYTGRMSSEQLNELMHPPGSKFDDFSKNPGPREFDKNHIGWSYNSCARPESSDPLLADQGVETGYVRINSTDRGKKPLSKQTVLVLFANGRIENVIVNQRTGRIVGDQVKDWSVLKD